MGTRPWTPAKPGVLRQVAAAQETSKGGTVAKKGTTSLSSLTADLADDTCRTVPRRGGGTPAAAVPPGKD